MRKKSNRDAPYNQFDNKLFNKLPTHASSQQIENEVLVVYYYQPT